MQYTKPIAGIAALKLSMAFITAQLSSYTKPIAGIAALKL